ncbi:MAG: phosphohydrolase, partial [Bacilli bacterium]
LKNHNKDSNIIKSYLSNMSDNYKNNNTNERIVIDYIAGMTDDYVLREYNNYLKNKHNKKE